MPRLMGGAIRLLYSIPPPLQSYVDLLPYHYMFPSPPIAMLNQGGSCLKQYSDEWVYSQLNDNLCKS